MGAYSYRTSWHVKATPEEVWHVIANHEKRAQWKVICKQVRIEAGNAQGIGESFIMHWQTVFPSRIVRMRLRIVHHEPFSQLIGLVEGELNGRIGWKFEHAQGGTKIIFELDLLVTVPAGKLLYWTRPLFIWNMKRMVRWVKRDIRKSLTITPDHVSKNLKN